MSMLLKEESSNLNEIVSLPKIVEYFPLNRISFSSYNKMKICLLKGLPDRCVKFSTKPPIFLKSKAQLLGIFFHVMLEKIPELKKCNLSDRPSYLKKEFYEQLSKFEKKYSSDSWLMVQNYFSKLPEIGAIYRQISNIIFTPPSQAKNKSEIKTTPEKALTSADGLLFGKVDALVEDAKEIKIIEYKTGGIFEEKYLKSEFYRQVHFYGELAYEEYGVYPTSLMVLGLNHEVWKNSPNIDLCKQLGSDARHTLNRYNLKVQHNEPVTNIAQTSNEACSGCPYQAFCPAYLDRCDEIELSKTIQCLKVKEIGIIEGTSSYQSALEVKVIGGRLKGKVVLVNGFYLKRFANYQNKPGRKLIITDLIVDYSSCSARFIDTSQIYSIEP
jgi:hypothetical protein